MVLRTRAHRWRRAIVADPHPLVRIDDQLSRAGSRWSHSATGVLRSGGFTNPSGKGSRLQHAGVEQGLDRWQVVQVELADEQWVDRVRAEVLDEPHEPPQVHDVLGVAPATEHPGRDGERGALREPLLDQRVHDLDEVGAVDQEAHRQRACREDPEPLVVQALDQVLGEDAEWLLGLLVGGGAVFEHVQRLASTGLGGEQVRADLVVHETLQPVPRQPRVGAHEQLPPDDHEAGDVVAQLDRSGEGPVASVGVDLSAGELDELLGCGSLDVGILGFEPRQQRPCKFEQLVVAPSVQLDAEGEEVGAAACPDQVRFTAEAVPASAQQVPQELVLDLVDPHTIEVPLHLVGVHLQRSVGELRRAA